MPDWRFQPCDFPAHGFFVSDRINRMDKMTSEVTWRNDSADSVHSVEKPLPHSRRIYVGGKIHPDIRVPFREITLAPTKSMTGEIEMNEPVRVYDTSGPWGDADFHGDVTQGLPPLRAKWIRERGDVEETRDGRFSRLMMAILSAKARRIDGATSNAQRPTSNIEFRWREWSKQQSRALDVRRSAFGASPKVLRAKSHAVTQLAYARQGIITPEMEFIAIRENGRRHREP